MTLAERIRDFKTKTGLSYKQMALNAGVSYDNLVKWKGGTNPGREDYEKITAYMEGKKIIEVDDPYEFLIKKATRNEAYLRTILMALAEILAAQRNESLIKVLDELTKVVGEEQQIRS